MVDKKAYSEMICRVRGNLSGGKFASRVVQYKTKNGNRICTGYSRNAPAHWEDPQKVPAQTETFLCIALMDYDKEHGRDDDTGYADVLERNRRYYYARDLLKSIMELELYCRNFYDACLIQVCRGILRFEEVPEMEKKYRALEKTVSMLPEKKTEYALWEQTYRISSDLLKTDTAEDFWKVVTENLPFFYTANRVLGERFNRLFESRERYRYRLSLADAVLLYAPNYRNTYKRTFEEFNETRDWLIDLCVHLRFQREEINQVLSYAHMLPLDDDPDTLEYYIREEWTGDSLQGTQHYKIGSGDWRRAIERREELPPCHFRKMDELSMPKKVRGMLAVACYTMIGSEENELPVVDQVLESLFPKRQGLQACKALEKLSKEEKYTEWDGRLQEEIRNKLNSWFEYLNCNSDFNLREMKETLSLAPEIYSELLDDYRFEAEPYYGSIPLQRVPQAYQASGLRMHYAAALIYSICTGKYYRGSILQEDLYAMKRLLGKEAEDLYYFLNHLMLTFLNGNPISVTRSGGFYTVLDGGETMPIDEEEFLADLWEAVVCLNE